MAQFVICAAEHELTFLYTEYVQYTKVKVAQSHMYFSFLSFPQNNGQITTLKFFSLGWKVEDCGLAHFFEEMTKIKKNTEIKPPLPRSKF